jgi:hypothetical protein
MILPARGGFATLAKSMADAAIVHLVFLHGAAVTAGGDRAHW